MTEAEKVICRLYLEDMDKNHTCNEYRLLMELLDRVPCEDAISRQAAIDEIARWIGYLDDDMIGRIQLGLKRLPSAQPEPHWIPCSERMPEEKDAGILKKLGTNKRSDYVLATVEVKNERMTITACTYDGVWHWDKKYAFQTWKVIAWMPSPKPYKAESER